MGQLNRGDLKSKNRNFNNILDSMLNLADTDAQTITSPVTLSSTLGVTGATTLSSTLDVTGAVTFTAQGTMPRRSSSLFAGAYTGGAVNATASAADSGTIFLVPAMDAAAVFQLPAAAGAIGATYTFVATGTTGFDFDVTTNGSEKILGAVPKGDGDNVAASDANDSVGFDANATSGSMFSVTCISATAGTAFIAHDILDGLAANTGGINLK